MANLFSVNNGKITYNNISAKELKNTKKKNNIEIAKQNYNVEKKAQSKIQSDMSKMFANQGVIVNTDSFSTQRVLLPVQNQMNIAKNKKFTVNMDTLNQDIATERKYRKILETPEYEEKEQQLTNQSNQVGYAKYNLDKEIADSKKVTDLDKIFGPVASGVKELFDTTSGGMIKNKNGAIEMLPSQNTLKFNKIMNSYKSGVGRFYGNATHELGRIGASSAINMVAPYVGSTMYFGKIFMDTTNNAVSEGYDTSSATLYGLVNTGWEYGVGKLLGSATKGLTGGKSSGYEEFLDKSFNKLLGKPFLSKVLANAGSEATEEFIQEYLDNFDKLLLLEKNKDPNKYISILKNKDIFTDAIYSAALGGVTGGVLGTISSKDTNVDNQDVYKTFKEELEQTKKSTTDINTIKEINELINKIDNIDNTNSLSNSEDIKNDVTTVIDLVEEEQQSRLNNLKSNTDNNQALNNNTSNDEENILPKVKDLLEEYFNITDDFSKAGFILKNGNMLDFSDENIKKEHSDIEQIVGDMDSYIKSGTIRIGDKSDEGILEIGKKPTNNQLSKIEDYSKTLVGKPLTVELHKGNSNLTIQYDTESTNPTKIRNDIKNYYQNNAIPSRTNILYNSDFQENLTLGQQQERLISNWISNRFIDDRNDPKIKKWIEGYPSIFPNGKIISNQNNYSQITQKSGNIPINQELLNKYKGVREIFDNESNNYDGNVSLKNNVSELEKIDVSKLKSSEVKRLAKEIFNKYNSKNTFENNGNKILVTNSGIEESVNKIFSSGEQRRLLKQHLKVFSDLGDIIEHATLVNQTRELKNRADINFWNYYFDGLEIDGTKYDFEFDVRSMNDGTNQYRVQRLKEKQQKKLMSQSRASTNNNVNTDRTFETSISENNISQFDNNVKLSNINNIDMQNNQINNKKILNPNEISNLTKKAANTTPKLPNAKVETGKGESKFYGNVTKKTKMLPDNIRGLLSTENDVQYYKEVTNKESLGKAYQRLNDGGQGETLSWFKKNSKNADSTDVAEGWILLKQYSDAKDYDSLVQVAKKMREIGTQAGQTVQAFNIMQRMTPEGMVKYAQSELSEAYNKMVKNKTKDWIDKHREDFDLKPNEVQFIMDTMKEVSKMNDGYDKRVKLAEIQKMMTDKLPPEKGAAIKSWMRISMLFNPKTQVRNVAGNALIAPVNYFGDIFSSYADKMISKRTGRRTTGNINVKAILEGMRKGAYQATNDYKKGINTKDMEGNRFEISDGKSFNDKTIMGKALNRTEALLNYVMDVGDRVFSEASFENSLQNQMVLNNTTEITQEMIDIAQQEALSRTWNDNNDYTRFVLNVRKGLNKLSIGGYGLGDVLIPFAKTPANLTKAIVDYSPAGLISTITSGINLKKSLSNGQYTVKMQHEFVQNLGKATAGTMLYILGYSLAKAGITSGDSDDDKDVANFLKNTLGINSYSIKIGNKTFTYDWAQPLAAPLSITANLVQKNKENANLYDNIVSSLNTAGNILLEQSFLDSLNTVLTNNEGIATGIQEAVLELPSRAIPTFVKQIADLIDGTQRQTFVKDQPLETAKNKVLAKIPFASKSLSSSVDTLGRNVKKYGGKNNIFNVFLNPANVNTKNISKSANEIYRLYKSTGETNIMPKVAPYYINQKGEKIILNANQREKYQKISGTIIENNLNKLLNSSEYKNMSDSKKSEIVSNIVNYSYNIAKKEVLGLDLSSSYQKAYNYSKIGSLSDYYTFKSSIDDKNKTTRKESITNYLVNSNLNNKQLAYLYGCYYSSEDVLKCMLNANIPIKEFIKYNNEEFTSDYYTNGKEVPNSRKKKVINYVNNLNLSVAQKALLIKMKYSSYKAYDKQIYNYVNSKELTFLEKASILKRIGFTSNDKQIVKYVNNLSKTKEEKSKILEKLGFKIRNGKVYSK